MSINNVASVGATNTPAVQSGHAHSGNKIGQDFNALAQLLNGSSDTSGVKNAFAKLLQDLLSQTDDAQTKVHHHRHHHAGADQAAAAGGANAIANSISAPAAATQSIHVTA